MAALLPSTSSPRARVSPSSSALGAWEAPRRPATFWPIYAALNFCLLAIVFYGLASNPYAPLGTGLFVLALGAVCGLPLLVARSAQDRHSLSVVFLGLFFLSFATGDIGLLLSGQRMGGGSELPTTTELVIIVSAICFLMGYWLALSFGRRNTAGICKREWATPFVRIIAIAFWIVGLISVYFIQTSFDKVLASPFWSQLAGILSLARLLNPLGALMMVYLYIRRGDRVALIAFLVFAACDFLMGLYGDTKEQAFRDPILYLITRFLLTRKIPIFAAVVLFAVAGATFSFFAEFRDEFKANQRSRAEAFEVVVNSFFSATTEPGKAADDESMSKRFAAGLDYVASRTGLKPSVEIIVTGTGVRAPFMEGKTIAPLFYAFIPRNFMPDKPDSSVGQTFNRAFKISEDRDTYISPSMNGELYWNFGWPGVVLGMTLMGIILSIVSRAVDLSKQITLPRLLILMMTVYLVCLRFEDGVAIQFTYWLRAVLLLLIIHALMPKQRQSEQPAQ